MSLSAFGFSQEKRLELGAGTKMSVFDFHIGDAEDVLRSLFLLSLVFHLHMLCIDGQDSPSWIVSRHRAE